MNRIIILLFSVCITTAFSQDFWVIRDSVNGPPRSAASAFVLDGEGYIVGGLDQDGFKRKMYSYDLSQDDWDDELSLGGLNGSGLNRGSATSFVIANKAYVGLGQGDTNPFFSDLWEYDPVSESWSQKANFIGESRRQATAFVLGDTAYVGTGYGSSGYLKDFYKYHPSSNEWVQLNDFTGSARKEACSFVIGNNGFICTGDAGVYMNDLWKYFPETDSWIQKADFPGTPRKGAASWSNGTKGFVATGEDNQFNYTNDVYEFNPIMNSWVQRADFIGPGRTNAIAFFVDGLAFLGTGYNGELLDDFYGYQPVLGISENSDMEMELSIYPNPALESAQIKAKHHMKDIKVFNNIGQDVSAYFDINIKENHADMEVLNSLKGTFYVHIHFDNINPGAIRKLIIQ